MSNGRVHHLIFAASYATTTRSFIAESFCDECLIWQSDHPRMLTWIPAFPRAEMFILRWILVLESGDSSDPFFMGPRLIVACRQLSLVAEIELQGCKSKLKYKYISSERNVSVYCHFKSLVILGSPYPFHPSSYQGPPRLDPAPSSPGRLCQNALESPRATPPNTRPVFNVSETWTAPPLYVYL